MGRVQGLVILKHKCLIKGDRICEADCTLLTLLMSANPKFGNNFGDFVRQRNNVTKMETGVCIIYE